MTFPPLYVSRPGVAFPEVRVENAEIIRRVRDAFRGPAEDWPAIESGIEKVFALCGTETRYLEPNLEARVADYAARAARNCLAENHATLDDVDLVICGSIPRQSRGLGVIDGTVRLMQRAFRLQAQTRAAARG